MHVPALDLAPNLVIDLPLLQDEIIIIILQPNSTTSQRTQHHSKERERSVSFSSSSCSTAWPLPCQTPNSALSSDDANNILNLLHDLQCEVTNFYKRISTLHLGQSYLPYPAQYPTYNGPFPTF